MRTPVIATRSDGSEAPPPRRRWRRALQIVVVLLIVALVLMGIGGAWIRGRLQASVPLLDGEVELAGLMAAVSVERDGLGVPTIAAESRVDAARALGFLHGQERFFQMDLLRRGAAGELSALLGRLALPADRHLRIHRFRERAARAVAAIPAQRRELLDAYVEGVNSGLRALKNVPVEYFVLRQQPRPWTAGDSMLAVYAMYIDLQDDRGLRELTIGLMHDLLPPALFEFLTPRGTVWDAPLDGVVYEVPPIPPPGVVDIRHDEPWTRLLDLDEPERATAAGEDPSAMRGSNSWAVAGSRTLHGGALLANDMHLGLGVPNIWYRAVWTWPQDGERRRLVGVTLPGVPALVAGSTGRIAWGFTNSYGDFRDLVVVELDPADPDRYRTADGWRAVEIHEETIEVKGGEPETLTIRETIWGPIIRHDHRGRPLAFRWVAYDPEAANLVLIGLEDARDVDDAVALANRGAVPAQNFTVVDAGGRIAWTLIGPLPRRNGVSGAVPRSWADGRGWSGWLAPHEYPRVIDPEDGLIWTANARVVSGDLLDKLGSAFYPHSARSKQIRDGLRALDRPSERDMLAVQLDDRALFLERWRALLLELLTDEAIADHPERAEFRRVVDAGWTGRASIDSAGYRLVRAYRQFLRARVFDPILAPCREADADFAYSRFFQWDGPLWKLVTGRPANLLHPRFDRWDELLLENVDRTIEHFLDEPGDRLADMSWGARNTARVHHPMGAAIPVVGRWLNMPAIPLPGDSNMPRVQGVTFGASERMVVSPGREERGIFHMPAGQSGHPLSRHYRAGHSAWVEGLASPLLPAATAHRLTLLPVPNR